MKNVEIIFVNELCINMQCSPKQIFQARFIVIWKIGTSRNILKSLADAPSQNGRRNVCRMRMTGRRKEIETFLLARVSL